MLLAIVGNIGKSPGEGEKKHFVAVTGSIRGQQKLGFGERPI